MRRNENFTLTEDGTIIGPREYMESEQFQRFVDTINKGTNLLVNNPYASSDVYTAILVAVQTDYAAWKGSAELNRALKKDLS